MTVATVLPQDQARAFVERYGTRAAKTARERGAAAAKRRADPETERYWAAVEREIEDLQRAGKAPVPIWGSVPKGDEKRSKKLTLGVPPAWYQLVTEAAEKAGVSLTDWIIEACELHARRAAARPRTSATR